jgi:sialic acid synthase SpsE
VRPSGPSAVLTDLDLLEYIARKGRPIVSTGMAALNEVDEAVERIVRHGQVDPVACTSAGPSEFADVNLRVMDAFSRRYGVLIGFGPRTASVSARRPWHSGIVLERHFPRSHAAGPGITPRRWSRAG